jgi:hypothetical protein
MEAIMKENPLLVLIFLLASAYFIPFQASAKENDTIELTVVKNDCLVNISRKYLEDPRQWPEIGQINHLKDYNLIRSGSRLVIPIRLLKGVPADGQVVFLKGEVDLKDRKSGSWKPLRQNDTVRQGNLIRTGHDGAVEIAFADGTGFFLKPDANLDLHTSQLKGSSHLLQRFILSTGRIFTKVRRATGRDSRIEIPTPSATAVVRGTDFRVAIVSDDASTCEVLDGTVGIEALRQKVAVREGEGTRVNKGEPPLKPRKLMPYPSLTPPQFPVNSMPFKIEFDRVKGAFAYRFILSKDSGGKDAIREKVITPKEALELSGLDDGSYYLQMRSIDEIGLEGPSSPPQAITVRLNPMPPFVREPVDGARIKGKSLAVTWLKNREAASYQIQVGLDREFRQPLGKLTDVQDTRHEIKVPDLGTYFFRIRSVAPDGYAGIWSDAIGVTLIPPPPVPDVEKPVGDGKELTIRWRALGEKMTYHFQVARNEAFRDPFVDRKVNRPEATLLTPEEVGIYYVRISAIDPDGFEGNFSSPQIFEVKRRLWPYAVGFFGGVGIILLILL